MLRSSKESTDGACMRLARCLSPLSSEVQSEAQKVQSEAQKVQSEAQKVRFKAQKVQSEAQKVRFKAPSGLQKPCRTGL